MVCFFIVSWNFPVTQLWEQVCAQRASGLSMNLCGCLCAGVSVCRLIGFSTLPASKRSKFNTVHCNSSGEHIYTKIVEEKGPGW